MKYLANIGVLHIHILLLVLVAVTAGPVEVVCAVLLGDTVQDEVVGGAEILLLDCL